jgi:type II secretory ATPase GspE/PulE/Tfp pilus assembly ATPase PilB-like protein
MRDGLVSKEDLEAILDEQRDTRQQRMSGHRLGEILIRRGVVTSTEVAKLVAEQYELPFVDLDTSDIDVRLARLLSEELARRFSAVPVSARPDGSYSVAIADPATVLFSDELRRVLGSPLHFAVVGPDAFEAAIAFVHGRLEKPLATDEPWDVPTSQSLVVELVPEESLSAATSYEDSNFSTDRAASHFGPPLGALLTRGGFLSDEELEVALAQQRLSTSWRLGEILVDRGIVTPSIVARLIAEQYELSFVELGDLEIDAATATLLPREIAREFPAVPIAAHADGSLEVAIADPTNAFCSDELHRALGVPLTFVVAAPDAIDAVLESVHAPITAPELDTQELADEAEAAPAGDAYESVPVENGGEPTNHRDDLPEFVEEVVSHEELAPPAGTVERPPTWTTELRLANDEGELTESEADRKDEPDAAVLESIHTPALEVDIEEQHTEVEPEISLAAYADQSPGVEDADEITRDQDDLPEFVEEVVATAEVVADEELVRDEEIVEWVPTWTSGLQLADAEGDVAALEVDREDEPDAVADDLAAVLLAEVTENEEPISTTIVDQTLEPSQTLALVEYEHNEESAERMAVDETPELAPAVAPAKLPEEHVELDTEDLGADAEDLDAAIEHVLALGASAIHFSPQGDWHTVRARIDGLVRELGVVGQEDLESLVERVETSAAMRADVMPTKQGDKVTLFPREQAATPIALADLGATGDAADAIHEALATPSGATVVCGPVGSGTTTTLYAALDVLNTPDRVVATVEDPVDRLLDGVDQVEIDEESGVTFASGLRALLANDSDAVLVGEIRDRETAEIAFRAALAGRHVLSALRVSSAAAAIRRLVDMGLEPSVVGGALTCVVAQRLVRRVCADCRETYYATEPELAELGQPLEGSGPRLLARGRGCETCDGSGFRGRVGIFEVLRVTEEIRALVSDGASVKKIHRAAVAAGMQTLHEDGVRLCLEGVTTAAEIQRILGTDH